MHDGSFHRRIIVNNVVQRSRVQNAIVLKLAKGEFDAHTFVEDHILQVLSQVSLTELDFGRGYVYSTGELVGIFTCQTEYLCHYAGDASILEPSDWISKGIGILKDRREVVVVNPSWSQNPAVPAAEAEFEDELAWYGYGFSDQCYLIRTADFQQDIYRYTHPDSDRYPKYGGELFEKRVDAWMRCNGLLRATLKSEYYHHPIF